MAFKPGFIAPPWPHVRGDSVSAVSLIRHIEEEAHRGCGLYYELYYARALDRIAALIDGLAGDDATTVRETAARLGFDTSEQARRESDRAEREIINQIRQEQI
ncbi:hypothetical protein ACS6L6_21575 [Enterobacter asburiae]|uniref:hypothetical protein n=1 Tax=Enterobacter asburiae TaxID=61645 RepID=UPI003F424B19